MMGLFGRFYNNFFELTPQTCKNNTKHVIRYLIFKVSLRYDLPPCPCFMLCHLMNKISLKHFFAYFVSLFNIICYARLD